MRNNDKRRTVVDLRGANRAGTGVIIKVSHDQAAVLSMILGKVNSRDWDKAVDDLHNFPYRVYSDLVHATNTYQPDADRGSVEVQPGTGGFKVTFTPPVKPVPTTLGESFRARVTRNGKVYEGIVFVADGRTKGTSVVAPTPVDGESFHPITSKGLPIHSGTKITVL